MRFTRLSLFIAGAVGVLILGIPRAAHAVVATLVQVANTASSPVITQGIGQQAAPVVQIECGYQPGSGITGQPYAFGCAALNFIYEPTPNSQYHVPPGETLVVTSVDIASGSAVGTPCMSSALAQISTQFPFYRGNWLVPPGAGTAHYVYPSGMLFPSGTALITVLNPVSSCALTVDMYGYLTAQ